ncbi:MAG: glycosyltransferase family 4 protein [Gammaproteobacteria bacterium]
MTVNRPFKLTWICKRRYTNKDLLGDRFGRLYHYPVLLGKLGFESLVLALDYRGREPLRLTQEQVEFRSIPLGYVHWLRAYHFVCDAARLQEPDAVLASGDSHLGWLGLHVARSLGVPFIFDVYDDYRTFGTNKVPGMRGLFRRSVEQADLVLCASVPLMRRLQYLTSRIQVLGNGVDPSLFRPLDKGAARNELGIEQDAPVVGYFGSMQSDWGTLTLIEACLALQNEFPQLRVLLAGHNNTGRNLGGGFVTYLGNVPQSRVPWLINACDVVAMPYHQTERVEAINPCKLAEYLACSAAIVASRVTDLSVSLAACPRGLCEPGDPRSLALALRNQLLTPCRVQFPKDMTWESKSESLASDIAGIIGAT